MVGHEMFKILLDGNADRPKPKTSLIPGIGRPQPGPQVYHPDDLWDIENFLDDLHKIVKHRTYQQERQFLNTRQPNLK